VIRHETNQGVIAARNSAVSVAQGEFFAMMDSDDVSHPERLAHQIRYLEQHPECGVVASRVKLIDAEGKTLGVWYDDTAAVTSVQIRSFLPKANCIANSSVMLRADLLRCRGYTCPRGVTEDYDLWLQLAEEGVRIDKLEEYLVCYRLTPGSLTAETLVRPSEYQQIRSKTHFLSGAVRRGRWGTFDRQVAGSLVRDVIRLTAKKLLRRLIGEWPDDNRDKLALQLNRTPLVRLLVVLSAVFGALIPAVNRSGLFFFFPFFHVGGAERVHADIVNCFLDDDPWIVFTKRSSSREFYSLFDQGARVFNLWPVCKYLYPFSIGIAAGFINRHTQPVVFGANSLFYALLLPFLKPHVRCCDLIHAFGDGVEAFALPVAARLDCRVVINQQTRQDLVKQYAEASLSPVLLERIVLIPNRVSMPLVLPDKQWKGPLRLLYVGRGGDEKRVHLIGRAARICAEQGLAVEVTLVGDLAGAVTAEDFSCCHLTGLMSDPAVLAEQYQQADLLLITSSREGFPLTVMEGMAHGCVPVCTAVGGIPEHITHRENGWLLPADDDEVVVNALVQAVQLLSVDRSLLQQLSAAARQYAETRFSGERFCEQYRDVIRGSADLR
jgi:glycosyltransferase involved in cell wall biosynthesis